MQKLLPVMRKHPVVSILVIVAALYLLGPVAANVLRAAFGLLFSAATFAIFALVLIQLFVGTGERVKAQRNLLALCRRGARGLGTLLATGQVKATR